MPRTRYAWNRVCLLFLGNPGLGYMHICSCASSEAPRKYWHEASKVKNMEIKTHIWETHIWAGGGGGIEQLCTLTLSFAYRMDWWRMILLAVGLIQQCVSYWSSMVSRYSVIANSKLNMIVMVPLIIITVLSQSRVILCQPLSSQLAGNMIPSQAYRLSGISWSMDLNCLILLNIKKVILLHNNIRMMKLYHRIESRILYNVIIVTVV